MLVAEVAAPKWGDYCIDVCAAPGGKSLHLADKLEGSGFVEARDITESKVKLMQDNIERTALINMNAVVADATVFLPASEEKADILLADVPCSGLGVIGRKPDIRYKMTEKKQEDIVKLQRQILDTVWKYVKVGGTLVYSTCTIGAEENQYNLKWFLDNYPFKLESIDPYLPEELQGKTTRAGYLQLLPGIHESDGTPGQIKEGIRMMEKTDIRSLNLEELKAWFRNGGKALPAGQLYRWMHQKLAESLTR